MAFKSNNVVVDGNVVVVVVCPAGIWSGACILHFESDEQIPNCSLVDI